MVEVYVNMELVIGGFIVFCVMLAMVTYGAKLEQKNYQLEEKIHDLEEEAKEKK